MTETLVDMAVAIEREDGGLHTHEEFSDWQCQYCGTMIAATESHCPCELDEGFQEYDMEAALDKHDWRSGHEPEP
jgi:hypothetical protein